MHPKILIVEDEPELRKLLTEELSAAFDVDAAANLAEARALAQQRRPDVALLDVRLPDGSGVDLCASLRSDPAFSRTKVIMLTGQEDVQTILRAFESGADDYIRKPFRMDELQARIQSKVRRIREQGGVGSEMGNLRLIPEQLKAQIGGNEVSFSTLEFALLQFFLERREKISSRRLILAKVWSGTVVSDRAVDAHIVTLRKKLDRFDHEIATVYGAGYVLRKRGEAGGRSEACAEPLLS